MSCRWIYDREVPGGRYWVPDCWGGLYGPEGCYCEKPKRRDIEDRLERIEAVLEKLVAKK